MIRLLGSLPGLTSLLEAEVASGAGEGLGILLALSKVLIASRMATKTLSHARDGRSKRNFAMKGGTSTNRIPSKEEVILRFWTLVIPSLAALWMTVTDGDLTSKVFLKMLLSIKAGVASRPTPYRA